MRIHTEWLRELVPTDSPAETIAATLTSIGLEVEQITVLKAALDDVFVGEILEKEPIEGAEGMFACRVGLGPLGERRIVCASEHPIEVGQKPPVALAGATLPTGIPIREGKFKGILSQGMICLDRELGILPRGTGLQLFPGARPGDKLVDTTSIPGALLEVAVLPNRPDCLGLVGIARELCAASKVALRRPDATFAAAADPGPAVPIQIEAPADCPRYTCRTIRGVQVKKSPMWLSSRLALAGFRPINNIVDVTNLVLYELGQPLHAFDLATLQGGISVRRARPGEKLLLLDDRTLDLDDSHLVIADARGPVALAGIMGGKPTGTTGTTADVLLESACFDAVLIRKTARALSLRTESSYRFERGTDPNQGVTEGLDRATRLILETAGGAAGPRLEAYPAPVEPKVYQLSSEIIDGTLGFSVPPERVSSILTSLGMTVSPSLSVAVPTWRADATDAVVLIEDLARHVGYGEVPMSPPPGRTTVLRNPPIVELKDQLRAFLVARGFWDVRTMSLDGAERLTVFSSHPKERYPLANPESADLAILRDSHFPRLLDVLLHNLRREREPLRFFEIDRRFDKVDAPAGRWVVSGVAAGPTVDRTFRGNPPRVDVFWLKGLLESACDLLKVPAASARFAPSSRPFLREGSGITLHVSEKQVAFLGQLSRDAAGRWDLPEGVLVFEIDVEHLAAALAALPPRRHVPVPRVPAVSRDLCLTLPATLSAQAILDTIASAGAPLVEEARCYDWFDGAGLPPGKISLTFVVRYRAPDRTLTAEEVSAVETRVLDELSTRHGAVLRFPQAPPR